MKSLLLSLSLLPIFAMAAPAAERPPFVGHYAEDCGPDFQCWLEIDEGPSSQSYSVMVIVADRQDFNRWTACSFPMLMHFAEDRLTNGYVKILKTDEGAISVSGFKPDACEVPLNGTFYPVGE